MADPQLNAVQALQRANRFGAKSATASSWNPPSVPALRPTSPSSRGKGGEIEDDKVSSVRETALVAVPIKEGRDLLQSLDTILTDEFRRDPEVLAKWNTASRIHSSPRWENYQEASESPEPPAAGN